jgi:NTP pyrophosphatase (non-canonical NTP hydrolase)
MKTKITKLPYDQELMTILGEEAAEVVQEASKCIRFGMTAENVGRLEKEIGDLLCMVELLHQHDYVSFTRMEQYVEEKREKLKLYSNLIPTDESNIPSS